MPDASQSGDIGHYTGSWGPWMPGIDPGERKARCRSLRALAQVVTKKPDHPLCMALRDAEDGEPETLEQAGLELNRLPALSLRDLLVRYTNLIRKPKPRRVSGQGADHA